MRSLQEWRKLNEFNGPGGQPDPTGMSNPVLSPGMANGPASPTMGTQPGMSMAGSGGSSLRQIYDQFMTKLHGKNNKNVRKIMDIFNKDAGGILSNKSGAPPLGPTS